MGTKSLPTFKHTSIGAKTHKARTTTAHVSYIMRSEAMTKFQYENMPDGGRGTRVFFDKLWEKAGMPENARIADKLMIALPVELNQEQRYELVESFMKQLGQGRIAWCAAHHDSGEDAHNPHAHIVFKDADIDTGRKVIGTTTSSRDVREAKEHGWKVPPRTTTADMRKSWCDHLNRFMERKGIDVQYDPRTLKEQGISREAQIHIGPKAQALEEKGYQFDSQDRIRGERAIAYSLLDQNSRAQHNSQIIDANRQKEQGKAADPHGPGAPIPLPPITPQEQERHELRETQAQARRAMYQEQQRDREALRQAQIASKLDHQTWAKQLYAKARESAFQSVKKDYAEKWQALTKVDDRKQREHAAAALKLEQKQAYANASTLKINECRPGKDAAWKAMQARHEKERLDLRTLQRQETSALARQQVTERLALHEKGRAQALDRQANRIDARLALHQGMAAQQRVALETMKLHARASQAPAMGGPVAVPPNPLEASRAYSEKAQSEQEKRAAIRATLLKTRAQNLERAAPAAFTKQMLSSKGKLASRALNNGEASPRATIAPGIRAAKDNRSANVPQHRPAEDTQNQIRQAVDSGQRLTDAERANASPDIKAQLGQEDRKAATRSMFMSASFKQKQRERDGRSGGGRGR